MPQSSQPQLEHQRRTVMHKPSVEHLSPELRADGCRIAQSLRDAGFEAWLVGGIPRDLALGRPVSDLDMATSATPDELESLFEISHAVGRAFGTLVLPARTGPVEVTTFRREMGYSDGRHPDQVQYTRERNEDAQRRDFTVNALYLDPLTDELSDPTGGWTDIENRTLRAVGSAAERFAEDGLRILRLARFAAVLGFSVDPGTASAAREGLENLRGVSPERVVAEWEKAGKYNVVGSFATQLDVLDALFVAHPALRDGLSSSDLRDHDLRRRSMADLPPGTSAAVGLGVLHRPSGEFSAKHAEIALRAMNVSRATLNRARALWENLEGVAAPVTAPYAAEWRRMARPTFLDDLRVAEACESVSVEQAQSWRDWHSSRSADQLNPEPLLKPADLLELGIAPGPEVGRLLRGLADAQLEGRVTDADAARGWIESQMG